MVFEIKEHNLSALEPLFKPWEEPTQHRLPNPKDGEAALIQPGRRPSKCPLVRSIRAFENQFKKLPVGQKQSKQIEYKERHLFTDEIVSQMEFEVGLLNNAWSASQYFAKMLGRACKISNAHQALTPLIERFLSEVLFDKNVDLFSGEADQRMRDDEIKARIKKNLVRFTNIERIKKKLRQYHLSKSLRMVIKVER